MGKTLGFYQNFNFDLHRLSTAFHCIQTNPEMDQNALAHCMGVNQPVAEGFSAWLRHTGLATMRTMNKLKQTSSYKLTAFGELASQHDPTLSDIGTQWVLHYYLATEHEDRSEAWHVLINEFLSSGSTFTVDQFQAYFVSVKGNEAKNRSALNKDPQTALSTYVRTQALGRLGILSKKDKNYFVGWPNFPHILVVRFLLLDWWENHHDQVNTLRLSELCRAEEGIGRICVASDQQVRQFVNNLTGLGYLSFSETQHEPVHRLYREPAFRLLGRYYIQR